jgi:hypothetical protein
MNTTTRERPILFSGEMVRALLDGRKTQTRRVVKGVMRVRLWQSVCGDGPFANVVARAGTYLAYANDHGAVSVTADNGELLGVKPGEFEWCCPYGVLGDRLWVRETHIVGWPCDAGDLQQFDEDGNERPRHVWYRATPTPAGGYTSQLGAFIDHWADDDGNLVERIPWKPSIHMPRWASRITLEITEVRVQRVQEISFEDAIAEGVQRDIIPACGDHPNLECWVNGPPPAHAHVIPEAAFRELWDSINAKRGFGWEVNPWVWAITFKTVNT